MRRSAGPTAQRPWQDGRLHLPLLSDESIVKPALVQLGQHPRQRLSQHSRFWHFFIFFINIIIILCFPGSAAAVTHRPLSYRLIALPRTASTLIRGGPAGKERLRSAVSPREKETLETVQMLESSRQISLPCREKQRVCRRVEPVRSRR